MNRVERRAITLWICQSLVLYVPLFGAAIAGYVVWESARWWLGPLLGIIGLLAVMGTVIEPWLRYRIHRWEVTDEAVYGLSGWFVREWRVAPISRIQTVDAIRGPIEQLLGLSRLRITTASSKGAIEIMGLDKDVAAKTAEQLTVITEKTPGDAT